MCCYQSFEHLQSREVRPADAEEATNEEKGQGAEGPHQAAQHVHWNTPKLHVMLM